ncbi:hypothetical protein BJY01DRAFT_250656 [Aspergillus pseudoustus]|uniref:Uncharacterized protein n=1 Tax=Aspergillus pseudoustus TaxID=1810923 RepID=A0ABR4JGE8_9EURO
MSPEREISNALKSDDPEALKQVLPRIRTSPRHDELIETILYETASNGFIECYKLVANEVFKRAIDLKSCMQIPPAIRACIRKNHRALADDLMTRILGMPHPEPRRLLMTCAFQCAVEAENTSIVKRVLDDDIPYPELQKAMRGAAQHCKIDVASLLLDDLMDEHKARDRAIAGKAWTEEIERTVRLSQAQCLMVGLSTAISVKAHEIAAFLLQPYLECLAEINPASHENFKKTEIFTSLADEVYLLIGRRECKKLLKTGIPVFAGTQIARCLRMDAMA